MASAIELVEKVQKTFAAEYGLTFFLTDRKGKVVTSAEGENILRRMMLEHEDALLKEIKSILEYNERTSRTIIYEIQSGMHVMTAPVSIDGSTYYYLWAGVLLEQDTDGAPLDESECTPLLEEANREYWLKLVGKLAELISLCLRQEAGVPLSENHIEQFRRHIQKHEDASPDLFSQIVGNEGDIEFIGLAEQNGEDEYTIRKIAGEGTEVLLGASFHAGEGFLGRAAITDGQLYWEDIGADRRSKIFYPMKRRPTFLFTDSIRRHDGSNAILFCGSFSRKKAGASAKSTVKIISTLVESSLMVKGLHRENHQQLTRLTSLVDVCSLMATAPDSKRMVLILLDISINLVEGPFSLIVIKDKRDGKGKLVTRGTYDGDLEGYVKNLRERTDELTRFPGGLSNEPLIRTMANGEQVIETPLSYEDELVGVLSVGVREAGERELHEHVAFLQTLSIMWGISLELAGHKEYGVQNEKVDALHHAISEFDTAAFERAKESAGLASDMAPRLEFPADTAEALVHACKLSCYSPDFVRRMLPNSGAPSIMEQGRMLLDEDNASAGVLSKAGYIHALCESYVASHSMEEVARLERIDPPAFKIFLSLVRTMQVDETEFELPYAAEADDLKDISETVESLDHLSPREKEVLILITMGRSNQDIAEALYISMHTVKNHITKIFTKLGVSDRAQVISKVYRNMHH